MRWTTTGEHDIQNLRVGDAGRCVLLSAAHGWDTTESQWRSILDLGSGFGIEEGGRLVAAVILTIFDEVLASVAMMVVAPEYGRRGMGRALMERTLDEAGDAAVFLYATQMGRDLYARVGFVDVGVERGP